MQITLQMTRRENTARYGKEPVALELEEYLAGVVPSEMRDSAPMEALKAQAICARTYALGKALRGKMMDDTAKYQAYRVGRARASPRSLAAVRETAGRVLLHEGEVISCYYSSCNGGLTRRNSDAWGGAALPYYKRLEDVWETAARRQSGSNPAASHGVGLSQMGAKYAAGQGVAHGEMLAFYYPGCYVEDYSGKGNMPTLCHGARGVYVTALQRRLRERGYGLALDGVFGEITQQAVRDFQAKKGLGSDGVAGKGTWEAVKTWTTEP